MTPSRLAVIAIILGGVLFVVLNVWIIETEPVPQFEKTVSAD